MAYNTLKKKSNNSTPGYGSFLMSTYHRYLQNNPRQHITQKQKYSRKYSINWSIFNQIRHIQERKQNWLDFQQSIQHHITFWCCKYSTLGWMAWFNILKLWYNRKIRHIYCSIHAFVITTRNKNNLRPRISFRVKTTDINNLYDIYSRTCVGRLLFKELD